KEGEHLPGSLPPNPAGGQLVGAAGGGAVARAQRELVELLAGGGGVLAGDAAAAQVGGVQADAAGDRLQGQVGERVGAQVGGHEGLLRLGGAAALHEARGEQ